MSGLDVAIIVAVMIVVGNLIDVMVRMSGLKALVASLTEEINDLMGQVHQLKRAAHEHGWDVRSHDDVMSAEMEEATKQDAAGCGVADEEEGE